jgi:uncharacterized protein (DUF362 family)
MAERAGDDMAPEHPPAADALDHVGLRFRETMAGRVALGETDARAGAARGSPLRFDVEIAIDSLGAFLRSADHRAALTGTVSWDGAGEGLPIRDGVFQLFHVDASGMRRMSYAFRFSGADGTTWMLRGHKELRDDRGVDVAADLTTLFTTLHRADEEAPRAAGVLRFDLARVPALLGSLRATGAASWSEALSARLAFASFAWGAVRDEYLADARLLHDTSYQNLVVAGALRAGGGEARPFFLVSGFHERGFPWGDGELFADVLLAIGDGRGGWRRYGITDRILEGMDLDVVAGRYRYRGPLFELGARPAAFSELREDGRFPRRHAELELDLEARPHDAVNVAFPLVPHLVRKLSSRLARELRERLPGERALGIFITPHDVTVRAGVLRLRDGDGPPEELRVDPAASFGEAERGAFRNVKEPTLLYGYLCAIRPTARSARVQIHSRTLRDERERWAKDRLDAVLGSVVSRTSSSELLLDGGRLAVRPLARREMLGEGAPLLRKVGEPLVELVNDHFPTAAFHRRIVEVEDPSGERCLALEEDVSTLRLEPIRSSAETAVAAIRDDDPLRALDRALDAAGLEAALEERLAASGKDRARFEIVVKPNFMFAYDRRDRSTYTDPALVHHLVGRLRRRGFERIRVVEAQSTYGEYFEHRSVREVAGYLGYDGSPGYEVVDLTLDAAERRDLGPHLGVHPVPVTWRDADFRISFAKNKTHAYAYYTLTLKNVYGALSLANKFKEYHCRRGIYATTIEYLRAYPVHFGVVDAYLSADGPFGIFADPRPNPTRTIVAGADLVAVDWVAASKMGIDPLVSPYMRLAVAAFGKPRIRFTGDPSVYRPWLNVPVALDLFTNGAIDADWYFGNVLYSACAQMDRARFPHRSRSPVMRLLRRASDPLRRAFFVRTGENPSLANRLFSRLFYELGF